MWKDKQNKKDTEYRTVKKVDGKNDGYKNITGLWISYIKYSSRRDGIAINTKMPAGTIVKILSIICPSKH